MNYYPDAKILAEQRFGFGPRLGQQTVPLANQLDETGYIHPAIQTLPTTEEILAQFGHNQANAPKLKMTM